jgi:signal transduction histidine kinase
MQTHEPTPRKSASQTKPSTFWRNVIRVIGLVAFIMFVLVFGNRIENLSYQAYLQNQKLNATLDLNKVRTSIEAHIFDSVLHINEMATVIGQNPDLTEAEFNNVAIDFLKAHGDIINIAAAPDQIVTMVFPRLGNEAVLGLNYRNNAAQYPMVLKAIQTGEVLITGPVNLVQGGRGLILRKPVYTHEVGSHENLWGIISVVLDYDIFVEQLGIRQIEERFDVLIHETAADGSMVTLLGDPALLSNDPLEMDFNFPFGDWKLAATIDGGWPTYRPGIVGRWATRITATGIAVLALFWLMRMSDVRRTAEQQLSNGIKALDHGFVMFDPDGKLVKHNEKYERMHNSSNPFRKGIRYQEMIRTALSDGLVPEALGREEEWLKEWSDKMRHGGSDAEQIMPDGRIIKTTDRLMEDGSVVGLRIDVSDLKEAQKAAEAANQAKNDFMGNLSHELRTPLTVILGHARLAQNVRMLPSARALDKALKALPETRSTVTPLLDEVYGQVSAMMQRLERSGDHLLTLISEILDFAKSDSGSLSVNPENVTLESIVEPVVDQMRPMIEEKGLIFHVTNCGGQIYADRKRIQQVLINLLSNASKFTRSGAISLDVKTRGDCLEFRVSDTGIGIPEDQIPLVFAAFHQVDSSQTRHFSGTGLGLAISLDIAKGHGGTLKATSVEGTGSIFTMSLALDVVRYSQSETPALAEVT